MRRCTCGFKEFAKKNENAYLGIGIDAIVFITFLFFLCMPLINTRSMMKKTENHTLFHIFKDFSSLLKCSQDISATG